MLIVIVRSLFVSLRLFVICFRISLWPSAGKGLVAIGGERADLLDFRLCCLNACRLNCLCSFPVLWNSIISIPDHCLLIYLF